MMKKYCKDAKQYLLVCWQLFFNVGYTIIGRFLYYFYTMLSTPSRTILPVHEFTDYLPILQTLTQDGTLGPDVSVGVIIGTSSHSPVPSAVFPKVVTAIRDRVLALHGVRHVWYGGDPVFRARTRGGNIADILRALSENGIEACALQRQDWVERTPDFVKKIVAYDEKLAKVGERKTFGGYENEAPEGFEEFLENLKKTCITPEIIPKRKKLFPVAATAGYLLALPCMAKRVVLIVVPQAGFITLKEVEYVNLVLQSCPSAPIFVYAILWKNMGENLNNSEKVKCKLTETCLLLQNMVKKFPERVFLVDV